MNAAEAKKIMNKFERKLPIMYFPCSRVGDKDEALHELVSLLASYRAIVVTNIIEHTKPEINIDISFQFCYAC